MLPKHRSSDLVVQEVGDETVVYDLISNRVVCLNRTSSVIWKYCTGARTSQEVALAATAALGSDVSVDVVHFALQQLGNEALLEDELPKMHFAGMSRREVIRRIGLTTAIAIPLVSSVTAPEAIHAQSACIPVSGGCTCTTPSSMRLGQPCASGVAMACANPACICVYASNGNGNPTGNCIP